MRFGVLAAVVVAAGFGGYFGAFAWLSGLQSLGAQGCVIEPGVERPVKARVATAVGHAEEQGDWLLIGPALCTITPPDITATLRADDPDVAPYISAVDAYDGAPGCFLNSFEMQAAVQATRGWSAERAFREYLAMFGAGVFSGEWRFFSASPLGTPVGPQFIGGACGNVPYADDLAESHRDLLAGFDGFIRARARFVPCEEGSATDDAAWVSYYEDLGQGPIVNAWHGFEVPLALLASDWVDGVGLNTKGKPRPPFCVPAHLAYK